LKWLEIGLTVEEELVEPVADVLSRHIPGGVAISPLNLKQDDTPRLVAVRAYLERSPGLEELRQAIERDLWYLSRIRPFSPPKFRWIEGKNWEEAWKEHFRPMLIGRSLRLQPAWLDFQEDDRRTVLVDPGMAFGTGAHPTTQLCLELLEDHIRPEDLVADLGCGSGILSIAAIRLGADRCLAYDIDPQSVTATRNNAELNRVGQRIQVRLGSIDELKTDALEHGPLRLVVANIVLKVLCDMLDSGLGEVIMPEGRLILSGVLAEQVDELIEKGRSHGIELLDLREQEDWRALVLGK
jgi:ribosomal protein L11 methyltransferase